MRSVSTPARMASGLPPNVVPWLPGPSTFFARSPTTMAPIGTPEPRPLASGITSGTMPAHWCANHLPVRPMPHCTSSKISCAPTSVQRARSAARNSRPMSKAPPTPCTGSTMTAAVSASTCAAMAPISRRGTQPTSKGARGNSYHFLSAPQVMAPAAAVRPWNAPSMATTFVRRVILKAMRSAFSLASAPELTKNTVSKAPPAKRVSRVAARARTSMGTALL